MLNNILQIAFISKLVYYYEVWSTRSPVRLEDGRSSSVADSREAYIVEVGIGEGWNTDVLRLGTTWKMLLNEQQR